jgi:hypothetical protein
MNPAPEQVLALSRRVCDRRNPANEAHSAADVIGPSMIPIPSGL